MALKLENNLGSKFNLTHANNVGEISLTSKDLTSTAYSVETIEELATVPAEFNTVIVKDLDRGGIFIYESTKVDEDNQGTNFNGWIRQYDGAVNVKWFGAKGDGVTDDTDAFLNALHEGSGNTLMTPAGTYIISTLTISSSIVVIGSGFDTVIKQKPATNDKMLQVDSPGTRIVFDSLTIDGNNSNQSYGTNQFSFVVNAIPNVVAEFRNVRFQDSNRGAISFRGDKNSNSREHLILKDCEFRGGTESRSDVLDTFTVLVHNGAELDVSGCDFDHGIALAHQGLPAITIQASDTSSVDYCRVRIVNSSFNGYGRFTSGTGIGVIDMYIWASEVIITGNRFTDSKHAAIRGKTNSKNVLISNNVILGGDLGTDQSAGIGLVRATYGPSVDSFVITNNIIKNVIRHGISLSGGGPANNEYSFGAIVTNNIIDGVSAVSGDSGYGVALNRISSFSVNGNEISRTDGYAIHSTSAGEGIGSINNNIIRDISAQGIIALSQPDLDLTCIGNQVTNATIAAIVIEGIKNLVLVGNKVKDTVDSGSGGQRGFRIGGSQGVSSGVVVGNSAVGTFAQGAFSLTSLGILRRTEYGNSWNRQEVWGSVPPSTGDWNRNDIAWNTSASPGGAIGWVCVTAGTPGTWKSFGAITA